jgi:hypothetical protein
MNDAERLDNAIQTAVEQMRRQYGKKRDDYYGLIFLEHVLGVQRSDALTQLAFGSHDLGIDGYYFDKEQETFRIFQLKNSKSVGNFHELMQRLIHHGIPALFEDIVSSPDHQPVVNNARGAIEVAKDAIEQIFVDFVFRGNPEEAEQSKAISALKEQIEEQAWRVESYFGDRVPL